MQMGLDADYSALAEAIVRQALEDYMQVMTDIFLAKLRPRRGAGAAKERKELQWKKFELDTFFHSGWFRVLCALDADSLLREMRRRARADAMKRFEEGMA